MSDEEYLRRRTREEATRYPGTPNLEQHQADYYTRSVVNDELARVRREEEQRRRERGY